MDSDAAAYIAAVEAADLASLPAFIKNAINALVVGLKADSNWTPIKASCLMAGPATLDGALVPLRGSAPTPFNFVPDDYDQFTGLKGNGTDKYLNANRLGSDDPQNSYHQSVFLTESTNDAVLIGTGNGNIGSSHIASTAVGNRPFRNRTLSFGERGLLGRTGFLATTRSSGSRFFTRDNGIEQELVEESGSPQVSGTNVFSRNSFGTNQFFSSSRIAFYSIGENITMAAMDSRLTTYMAALAAGPTGRNVAIKRRRRTAGGGLL